MAKTRPDSPAMMAVKDAEERMEAANEQLLAAKVRLEEAGCEYQKARNELIAARKAVDSELPQASIIKSPRYGRPQADIKVVIIRRTEKAIFTRYPGDWDMKPIQFRQDRFGWVEFGGIGDKYRLKITEDNGHG